MRRVWLLLVLAGFVCVPTASNADGPAAGNAVGPLVTITCGQVFDEYSLQCAGCPGDYYGHVLYATPGWTAIYKRIYFCCNGRWVWDTWSGGWCGITKLTDPAMKQALARLAAREDILIPSCDGTLLPAELFL